MEYLKSATIKDKANLHKREGKLTLKTALCFRPEDVTPKVVEELKNNDGFVHNKRRGTAHLFR